MGIWNWHREESEDEKVIVKIYNEPFNMIKAYKRDLALFECLGVLTKEVIQSRELHIQGGIIRYYHMDSVDNMRGFSIDMAIIDELATQEDYDQLVNEQLAPALFLKNGKVVK